MQFPELPRPSTLFLLKQPCQCHVLVIDFVTPVGRKLLDKVFGIPSLNLATVLSLSLVSRILGLSCWDLEMGLFCDSICVLL